MAFPSSNIAPKDLDHERVYTISILSELETLLFDCETHLPRSTEADSRSDNEHPSNGPCEEKKASRWKGVNKLLCLLTIKNAAAKRASYDSGGSQGGKSRRQNQSEAGVKIQRLRGVIGQMKTLFKDPNQFKTHNKEAEKLKYLANELKVTLKKMDSSSSEKKKKMGSIGFSEFITEIEEISKDIFYLKSTIDGGKRDLYLAGLHKSKIFVKSSAFEELKEKFRDLDIVHKLCLLSFTVFPENKEVNKTMLMYWWLGEGFFSAEDVEVRATETLEEFWAKGLIEPVKDDRKLKPNSYKMEPHVHSAVIYLAEELGFFDIYKEKGKPFMAKSEKHKVCLVKGSSSQQEAKVSKMKDLESVKTVFNSSERFPDFTFKWFPVMRSLEVLYLGRWERTPERHIEVEGTMFLQNIKTMKELKLVSFQGISRIEKLDSSICQLPKLVILDLRSCYNLEVLPDEIDSLESLIYLDVSECYMLDRMPKEIAELSNLQVMKGFVVSDADEENCCTLSHLKRMQRLRKLSININKFDLEVENLMESLAKLTQLESLKIAWGARFPKDESKKQDYKENSKMRDEKIEKVDQEESKERDGFDTKTQKSDEVIEEDKKVNLSQEPKPIVQKKLDYFKGDNKEQKKEDGKKEVDQGESKEHGEIEAENQKSDKIIEEDKKVSPSLESKPVVQKKVDDLKGDIKEQKKEDGKKEVDQGESKERGEIEAENQKSDKIVEEDKKLSPSQESKPVVQKKLDDLKGDIKEQKEEDGEKEVDREESKEHDGVETETQKLDKIVGEDKASPSQEPKPVVQKKLGDLKGDNKEQKKEDGKKEVDQGERKERGEIEVENQKSDKIVEEDKVSPSQESKPVVQKKLDDLKGDIKEQKKKDGEKEVDQEESKEQGGVEAQTQKLDKIVEEDKKMSASQESKATIKELDDLKEDNARVKNAAAKPLDSSIGKKRVSESEETHDAAPTSKTKKTSDTLFSACKLKLKGKGGKIQDEREKGSSKFPSRLKKLELECFPEEQPPSWLNPKDLINLEKLSIRGGKLSGFRVETPSTEGKCGIQVLRLKYLDEFKAEWKDLLALFPSMTLLEKYKCPKVTFCPTDGNGVWRRSQPQASTQKPE